MEGMGLSRSLMTLKHCTGMVDGKKRYLVRPKRYERKEPSRDSRKIYIYCEGNRREYDYFMFFRGLSSNVNIIPIPSKHGKTDPKKLMEAAYIDFFGSDERKAVFQLDVKQMEPKVTHALRYGCIITSLTRNHQQKPSQNSHR